MKKTLLVIALIAALLLAATFGLDTVARKNAQKEHIWLMETLLPGGESFEYVEYTGEDANIKSVHKASVGYVIETVTQGYADEIRMVIGVSNDGNVTGLVVLDAHETPGLGGNILTDHKFLSQFLNKNGSFAVGAVNAEADIFSGATGESTSTGDEISVDGISGATVSSKAVVRCVNSAIAYVTGADVGSSATTWGG